MKNKYLYVGLVTVIMMLGVYMSEDQKYLSADIGGNLRGKQIDNGQLIMDNEGIENKIQDSRSTIQDLGKWTEDKQESVTDILGDISGEQLSSIEDYELRITNGEQAGKLVTATAGSAISRQADEQKKITEEKLDNMTAAEMELNALSVRDGELAPILEIMAMLVGGLWISMTVASKYEMEEA